MFGKPCQQQCPPVETCGSVHSAAKERRGILVGRSCREDDWGRTPIEELEQRRRQLLVVGLVVLRESCQSQLRRPIGLWRSKPIRKKSNHALRRVQPVTEDA